jgi:tripartite-type tricarboxylate transporter receptor subunit TctC
MQCCTEVPVPAKPTIGNRAAGVFAGSLLLAALFAASSVSAENVAEFYKGKTVTIVVGSGAGGGYDTNTRLLARHMSRHIPGEPHIIVQNMPAASGIAALNHVYTIAPRDGTVFSAVVNNMPYDPLFGGPAARFDVFQLNWLGSLSKQTNVCLAWKGSQFKTLDDVMQQKMRVSATGATGWRSFLPRLFNGVAGTQFEVINGYDSPGSMLAVARGEVDGICADYATVKATQSDWINQGKIVVLAQFGLTPLAGLDHVPMGIEQVKDTLDRQAVRLFMSQQEFGRPYVMPPEVPKDRLAALRAAFEATMTDPAFLQEAEKIQMDVSPLNGAELDKLFQEAYASSPEVVARTKVLLQRAGAL